MCMGFAEKTQDSDNIDLWREDANIISLGVGLVRLEV